MRHSVVTDIVKVGGLVRGFRVSLFGEATRVLEKADRDRGLICFACGIAIPKRMKYYCFSQCLMAARELVFVVACEECSEVLKDAISACFEKRTQRADADRCIGDAGSVPPAPGGVRADQEAHPATVRAP